MESLNIRVNEKDVIFEFIDGEVVMLNLSNGNYFTLDNLGVIIWNLIIRSGNLDVITESVYKLYKGSIDIKMILKTILDFTNELVSEGLVIISDDDKQINIKQEITLDFTVETVPSLTKPILHSYREIQEKYIHPCGIKRSDE